MHHWSKSVDPSERQTWEDCLEMNPVPGMFLEEDLATGSLRLQAFCPTPQEADELARRFGGTVSEVLDQDWVSQGSESWRKRSLSILDRILVSLDDDPAFLATLRNRLPARPLLVIPPELAFGTGDHETTSACLERVVEFGAERPAGWSLLDLGTGTAILAMAGYQTGASRIVASEIDAMALQTAQRNLDRNGIPPGAIELRLEDVLQWQPEERFDLICANLYAGILLQVIPVLPRALAPDGRLCLSGILLEQESAVAEAARLAGFARVQETHRGKWATLFYRGPETKS